MQKKIEYTVNYVYEEVKSNVVVNYVDEAGNPLDSSVTNTDKKALGTEYDTNGDKKATIEKDGKTYILVENKTADVGEDGSFTVRDGAPVESGSVTLGTTHVIYIYKEQVAVEQEADLTFKLEENGEVKDFPGLDVLEAVGANGAKISFADYEAKLEALKAQGYEVVRDEFLNDKTFDEDLTQKQHIKSSSEK